MAIVSTIVSAVSVVSGVTVITILSISSGFSLTFLSGIGNCGFFGGGGCGENGESITVSPRKTISVMSSISDSGNNRSMNLYVNCAGCNNGIFVGNSVSVGNSVVKIGGSISIAKMAKTIAKMGDNSGGSMGGSEDGGVGLTLLAAPSVVSTISSIVSSIVSAVSTVVSRVTVITIISVSSRIGCGVTFGLGKSQTHKKKGNKKFHDDRESE